MLLLKSRKKTELTTGFSNTVKVTSDYDESYFTEVEEREDCLDWVTQRQGEGKQSI